MFILTPDKAIYLAHRKGGLTGEPSVSGMDFEVAALEEQPLPGWWSSFPWEWALAAVFAALVAILGFLGGTAEYQRIYQWALWGALCVGFGAIPIVWFVRYKETCATVTRENRLIRANKALHAKLDEYHRKELHNVRERAQRLEDDILTLTYAREQSGEEINPVERWAFKDRILQIVHDFEQHGIRDNHVTLLLANNYLKLDDLAHGLGRMVEEADGTRRAAEQKRAEEATKRQLANLIADQKAAIRRDAREMAARLSSLRSNAYMERADMMVAAEAEGKQEPYYAIAVAEFSACISAKAYAIAIDELFAAFKRYGVEAKQPPPTDWIHSPATMAQVLFVESCLTEMADMLK